MGSDMWLTSPSSPEQGVAAPDRGSPEGQGADAGLEREGARQWADVLPLLLILLLLLLSPVLYDLLRWLGTH